MKTAAIVLVILGACFALMGLIPCLGWLNWVAAPMALAAAILGIIGLSNGAPDEKNTYIVALVMGLLVVSMSTIRCLLGGGIV